jgi:hypothetical protein
VARFTLLEGDRMTKGDAYRVKASEFAMKAKTTRDPAKQLEHAKMAAAYLRLAEHADRNAPDVDGAEDVFGRYKEA